MAGRFSPAALFRSGFFGSGDKEPRKELGCELLVLWAEWEIEEIMSGGTWSSSGIIDGGLGSCRASRS